MPEVLIPEADSTDAFERGQAISADWINNSIVKEFPKIASDIDNGRNRESSKEKKEKSN